MHVLDMHVFDMHVLDMHVFGMHTCCEMALLALGDLLADASVVVMRACTVRWMIDDEALNH